MNWKILSCSIVISGMARAFAPVDCPFPPAHGECDHKKPSASQESCHTPIQVCAGAGQGTCATTINTLANAFPKSDVENAHRKENEVDCWLEHTNSNSINQECFQTATCFWNTTPATPKCDILAGSESTWTWKLKRLKVPC